MITFEKNKIANNCFYMKFLEEMLEDKDDQEVVDVLKDGISETDIYHCNYTDYFDASILMKDPIRSSCFPALS